MSGENKPLGAALHLLRVTIEAASPVSLGSGDVIEVSRQRKGERGPEARKETTNSTALVRDANGLPTIPGSTLQGLLHHRYRDEHGDVLARKLFGYADGTDGDAGRLVVGFGTVHGQNDQAVAGLIVDAARISDDPVLLRLHGHAPLRRDHVSLNGRHVADGRKKYDRRAVPVGTRFSIEFSLWGDADETAEDKAVLEDIVRLFSHPAFRLGGGGRHGYGRITIRRASYTCPDLGNPIGLRRIRDQIPSLPFEENLLSDVVTFDDAVTMKLKLTPINPWRIGGEGQYLTEETHGARLANGSATAQPGAEPRGKRDRLDVATILREPIIMWANGKAGLRIPGQTSPFDTTLPNGVAFAVPGSAIKGPLVHRSLFHWNRQRTDIDGMIDVDEWLTWDDDTRKTALEERTHRPARLASLFGAAKERDDKTGKAGRAYIDDGVVSDVQAAQAVDHIVIDRFTGGVIPGLLYVEEVLVGGSVDVTITVSSPARADRTETGDWPREIRDAFLLALRDLCGGRLAIGAKSLGYCTGDIVAWEGSDPSASAWKAAWDALAALQTRRDAA